MFRIVSSLFFMIKSGSLTILPISANVWSWKCSSNCVLFSGLIVTRIRLCVSENRRWSGLSSLLVGILARFTFIPSWPEIAFLARAIPRPPNVTLIEEARRSWSTAFLKALYIAFDFTALTCGIAFPSHPFCV